MRYLHLELDKLNVYYGRQQVLYEVSLGVKEGEIVSLIGANGSGKTTLFKTISGLINPESGEIKLRDKRIDGLPPKEIAKLGIAHVPEGRKLFPYLTVKENLDVGTYTIKDGGKDELYERVYNLFPRLRERKDQMAETLSGGEAQMLSIGRALMMRPKICLLDEVSLGLMPKLIDKLYEIIKEINSEGISILLAEQSLQRNLDVADRLYVMRKGRVVSESSKEDVEPEEIKREYFGE